MKCPNCNFEVAGNTKFCPECGTKMPETTAETTASFETAEGDSSAPSNVEINEKKKAKKKKLKKIIIISASALLACGLIFLVLWFLNPFCMFGHSVREVNLVEPTCTENGRVEYACNSCDYKYSNTLYAWKHRYEYKEVECKRCGEKRSCDDAYAEHEYENAVCGKENTCVKCGEKKNLQHELKSNYDSCCMHCGQDKFSVKLPTTPITAHKYDGSNNIEQSCVITQLETSSYFDSKAVKITFTVKRTYHENGNNHSASAKFGWKLYAADGTVVDGGTAYSDGTIAVGEQSKGDFIAYNLSLWEEYRLEILNLS